MRMPKLTPEAGLLLWALAAALGTERGPSEIEVSTAPGRRRTKRLTPLPDAQFIAKPLDRNVLVRAMRRALEESRESG